MDFNLNDQLDRPINIKRIEIVMNRFLVGIGKEYLYIFN